MNMLTGQDDMAGALPAEFVGSMNNILGESQAQELLRAIALDSPTSVRINTAKLHWSNDEPVAWCSGGYYLGERLNYTFDPLFHAGAYYVQEASSMFLDHVVRSLVHSPVLALDMCAAPGGKSTVLLSALPDESMLVANEVIRNRVLTLAENLTKWGRPDVIVTNNQSSDFARLTAMFDFILVDAPCSGEGMFRKDRDAVREWSPDNVAMCAQRQRKIVADVWQALKPGGIMVYSTCTYNLAENEDNVHWMIDTLGALPLAVDIDPSWGITGALDGSQLPVYRFMPHKTRGEGLFMAVLRKDEQSIVDDFWSSPRKTKKTKPAVIPQAVKSMVTPQAQHDIYAEGDAYLLMPKRWEATIARLKSTLRQVKAGTQIATVKGKDIIPSHQLAMSCLCNKDAFPSAELEYDAAIAYLRKGQLQPPLAEKGFALLTYNSVPLGFIKNLGNRCNNLYPQDYRIMTTYDPDNVRLLIDAR